MIGIRSWTRDLVNRALSAVPKTEQASKISTAESAGNILKSQPGVVEKNRLAQKPFCTTVRLASCSEFVTELALVMLASPPGMLDGMQLFQKSPGK